VCAVSNAALAGGVTEPVAGFNARTRDDASRDSMCR